MQANPLLVSIRRVAQVAPHRTEWVDLGAAESAGHPHRQSHDATAAVRIRGEDGSRPLDPRRVSVDFSEAVAAYGLPPIGLRGLRHTHAALLLQAGVPPGLVSERLGHPTVTATLERYGRFIPSDDARAAHRLSQIVWHTDAV